MPACESKLVSRSSRKATVASGGSRNLGGVQLPAREARWEIFWLPRPLSVT